MTEQAFRPSVVLALAQATYLGHRPEPDPPDGMSSVERWTCPCGAAVVLFNGNTYGSATTATCPLWAVR